MVPATRFESAPAVTVDVLICWECGAEDPPLYRRTTIQRNATTSTTPARCDECGVEFIADDTHGPRLSDRRYCSQQHANIANRRHVKRPLWERYRKAAS
jgi:hypothetical protein